MIGLAALADVGPIRGFPAAIIVFTDEHRRRLGTEENELHRRISEEYDNFLRLALGHADLLLWRRAEAATTFTEEQLERRDILFRMLVSLFEKAYIILYTDGMDHDATRRWLSWEDDMREWCRRPVFCTLLPKLLEGEDDAFSAHIRRIAEAEARAAPV